MHMGRLIDVAGDTSTRYLSISRAALVADVVSESGWQISRCINQMLRDIAEQIRYVPCPSPDSGEDVLLWRYPHNVYRKEFSAVMT